MTLVCTNGSPCPDHLSRTKWRPWRSFRCRMATDQQVARHDHHYSGRTGIVRELVAQLHVRHPADARKQRVLDGKCLV
jgi:hypothetical protein